MATTAGGTAQTGTLSAGAAATGGQGTPPAYNRNPSNPTGPPSTPSGPTEQSLEPTNPGTVDSTVTTAQGGTVGNAPTANASDVKEQAAINGGQINPNDATNSASQVAAITNQNSPYIQQAIQQGLLSAASRGLENSSLGAGAAEASAVQAAAPLAEQNAAEASQGEMQNAQLNTQASEFNASQENANKQLQAQIDTQTNQFNAGEQTQNSQFNAQSQNQMRAQTQALTEQLRQQFLSGTQAQQLASIQGEWNSFIASNQTAATMYQQTLQGMSQILNNKDIDPTRAGHDIQIMLNLLQGAFKVMNTVEGGTGGGATVPGAGNPSTPTTSTAPTVPTPRTPGYLGIR